MNQDIRCRGCYILGSACGSCKRCCDELVMVIRDIRRMSQQGKPWSEVEKRCNEVLARLPAAEGE